MARGEQRNVDYETPKWRTFWMLIGFVVLVGIGAVTVLRPELEDQKGAETSADTDRDVGPGVEAALQE